ncbi:DUF3156 family protein [Providencia rettgeri]|nr:DUF3156 family protein [Providencia sp. PROV024]MDR9617035.1 DUF3156 family protein [Providencia rettgeri]
MSHYATSPKYSLWQRLGSRLTKKRLPVGYQTGLTLNRIERDMLPYPCEWRAPGALLIQLQPELTIEVTERPRKLFLAFIVYSRFAVSGICHQDINAKIEVKTRGSVRKKHIHFVSKQIDGAKVIGWLNEYPIIRQTLEELDFNRCQIELNHGQWRCEIEPFTASEMVSRIPATRRYLRLESKQRHRLLSALQLISQLMEKKRIIRWIWISSLIVIIIIINWFIGMRCEIFATFRVYFVFFSSHRNLFRLYSFSGAFYCRRGA